MHMNDFNFTASPFHQAAKKVLVDSGRQMFGMSDIYLQHTIGALEGGTMEEVNIAKLRGRMAMAKMLQSNWRVADSNNRKKPGSYYWNNYAKELFFSICRNELLISLSKSTQEQLQENLKAAVESEQPGGYEKSSDIALSNALDGNYWILPVNNSTSEALVRERLWEAARSKISMHTIHALLQDSYDTAQAIYNQALELGGQDPIERNLRLLATVHPATGDDLAVAHELLSFTLALETITTPQTFAHLLNQVQSAGWTSFLSGWEGESGFRHGSFDLIMAPDGWLGRVGLAGAKGTIGEWVEQKHSPIKIQHLDALLGTHCDGDRLLQDILGCTYRPHAQSELGIDDFPHLGMDGRNLASFAKSGKPMRLLLVGESGTGKTSLISAISKLRGLRALGVGGGGEPAAQVMGHLSVLQNQGPMLGHPLVVIDPMDTLLGEERGHIEKHLMDGSARAKMTTSEVWTLRRLKDAPSNLLPGFDLIVHLKSMPLADREILAAKHFEPTLAKRVAQMSSTAGEIIGTAQWAQTSDAMEWSAISARLNGLQEAVIKTLEANEALPLQSYKPGSLQLGFGGVAGQDQAVSSAKRLIGSLRDPQRFRRLNATTPKGVLLTGGPGMGKTHLARAMAVEAGVPFLLADCAAMARNASLIGAVFAEARRMAPCILFLDELDAIGTAAKGAMGGSPDPARQGILNRLLMELDGVEALDGVLVVGATHRADLLDEALVRSGRLGWRIALRKPDTRARKALWLHYAQEGSYADTIDWMRIARMSSGMTPADICQAFNTAAMTAVEQDDDRVGMQHLTRAIDATLWKSETVDLYVLEEERWRTAVHEAGHALMAWQCGREIERVSVQPRSGALGHVRMLEEDGRISSTPGDLMAEISICFGGLAAEEVVFGRHSTGASMDLEMVRNLVQRAVRVEGMDERFPGGVDTSPFNQPSPSTLNRVERAESQMLSTLRTLALQWLGEHRSPLEAFAKVLLDQRELDGPEVEQALGKLLPEQKGKRSATLALAAKGFGPG